MGKGSQRRPRLVSDTVWGLNYDLAHGNISRRLYNRRMKKLTDSEKGKKR